MGLFARYLGKGHQGILLSLICPVQSCTERTNLYLFTQDLPRSAIRDEPLKTREQFVVVDSRFANWAWPTCVARAQDSIYYGKSIHTIFITEIPKAHNTLQVEQTRIVDPSFQCTQKCGVLADQRGWRISYFAERYHLKGFNNGFVLMHDKYGAYAAGQMPRNIYPVLQKVHQRDDYNRQGLIRSIHPSRLSAVLIPSRAIRREVCWVGICRENVAHHAKAIPVPLYTVLPEFYPRRSWDPWWCQWISRILIIVLVEVYPLNRKYFAHTLLHGQMRIQDVVISRDIHCIS